MSKFCPLFSGSGGNSSFIGWADGGVLIDVGVSGKQLFCALEQNGIDIELIKAVMITHEHIDHIKGLSVFLKKHKVPVIGSPKTLQVLSENCKLPENTELCPIEQNKISVSGAEAVRFETSHDCDGSSGYSLSLPDGRKISVCTDLGVMTDNIRNVVSGSDLLLIESNHDLTMLKNGPYPPQLKLRIMGEKGHLSNNACAAELPEFLKCGTTRFVLGHLSTHNNLPALAKTASENALLEVNAKTGSDYILYVAPPKGGEVFYL